MVGSNYNQAEHDNQRQTLEWLVEERARREKVRAEREAISTLAEALEMGNYIEEHLRDKLDAEDISAIYLLTLLTLVTGLHPGIVKAVIARTVGGASEGDDIW